MPSRKGGRRANVTCADHPHREPLFKPRFTGKLRFLLRRGQEAAVHLATRAGQGRFLEIDWAVEEPEAALLLAFKCERALLAGWQFLQALFVDLNDRNLGRHEVTHREFRELRHLL